MSAVIWKILQQNSNNSSTSNITSITSNFHDNNTFSNTSNFHNSRYPTIATIYRTFWKLTTLATLLFLWTITSTPASTNRSTSLSKASTNRSRDIPTVTTKPCHQHNSGWIRKRSTARQSEWNFEKWFKGRFTKYVY